MVISLCITVDTDKQSRNPFIRVTSKFLGVIKLSASNYGQIFEAKENQLNPIIQYIGNLSDHESNCMVRRERLKFTSGVGIFIRRRLKLDPYGLPKIPGPLRDHEN